MTLNTPELRWPQIAAYLDAELGHARSPNFEVGS